MSLTPSAGLTITPSNWRSPSSLPLPPIPRHVACRRAILCKQRLRGCTSSLAAQARHQVTTHIPCFQLNLALNDRAMAQFAVLAFSALVRSAAQRAFCRQDGY